MVDPVQNWNLYKVPSHQILGNRLAFYGLRKEFGESIDRWLKRVQSSLRFCEFPTIIVQFLLIDRFLCALSTNELKSIQSTNKSWTLNQLMEHFLDNQNFEIASIDENAVVDEDGEIDRNQPMDIVNFEAVSVSSKSGLIWN